MANRTYHPRGQLVQGFRVQEHPSYTTWANMLARCYNPDSVGFKNYGGRGIGVCPAWHHFENFAADMGVKPFDTASIERKDNMLGYGSHNCVWATRTEQAWNRRTLKSNTSGFRGVVRVGDRYLARFDYETQRYEIGRFDTAEAAHAAREAFVGLFFRNREAALQMLEVETVWATSTTKVRGVTPHKGGGFIARTTVGGVRQYIGYFQTIEAAQAAIQKAKASHA